MSRIIERRDDTDVVALGIASDEGGSRDLTTVWQPLIDDALSTLEQQTLQLLAESGVDRLPVVGEEHGAAGLILDIAWPDLKKAVVLEEIEDHDRAAYEAEGWTIVGPGAKDLVGRLGLT